MLISALVSKFSTAQEDMQSGIEKQE